MNATASETWVVRIPTDEISPSTIAVVGDFGDVAMDERFVWFRLHGPIASLQTVLAAIPGLRWSLRDDRLFRLHCRVPDGRLPQLDWRPVHQWAQVELPRINVAAKLPQGSHRPLRLARGGRETPSSLMLTSIAKLARWAEGAPDERLRLLRWVVRKQTHPPSTEGMRADPAEGECLILGSPLPPIEGQFFVVRDRIAVPAGHQWLPRASTADVRQVFGLTENDWLIWESTDQYSVMDNALFATATRGSIRQCR
jgi:hypothetical protein